MGAKLLAAAPRIIASASAPETVGDISPKGAPAPALEVIEDRPKLKRALPTAGLADDEQVRIPPGEVA